MLRSLLPLALCACLAPLASAQSGAPFTTFVDCPGRVPGCDLDFFQTEVRFTRFVRDPANADAYVLIVDEDTGGGGERYTLFVEGRRGALAGRRDTLVTSTPPGASDDDQRRALLNRLAIGIASLAARTALADRLTVGYDAPVTAGPSAPEPAVDPWNSWVFRLGGDGRFNGQSQSQSYNVSGSFSAQRITEALKVSVRPRASYNRREFDLSDGGTFVSDNASYGLNTSAVVSLTDHWSAGGRVDVSRATFSNYDLRVQASPAIEYSVFPYDEATRRQVRMFYRAGAEAVAYQDTTVLGEISELLPVHEAGLGAEFTQPWGSVDLYSSAFQYLSRPDKYNLSVGGGMDLRLFRGLSLRVNGRYEFVRDQINLPAERAEDGQILTGDQELPTGFEYRGSIGISYSFGSIYNQVVNARFGD